MELPRPISKYYSSTFLEGLRKTTKTCTGIPTVRGNTGNLQHDTGYLTTKSRRSLNFDAYTTSLHSADVPVAPFVTKGQVST
jgi:hypothetical protein